MSLHLWYRVGLLLRMELRLVRKAYRRAARRWRLRNWQKHPAELSAPAYYFAVNAQLRNALQNAYPLPRTLGQLQGIAQYQAIGRQATMAEFNAMMQGQQQLGGLGNALGNAIPGLASMIGQ